MRIGRPLTDVLRGVADLVLAPSCSACRGPISPSAEERLVCAACWARARPLPLPRCERCWTPFTPTAGSLPGCRVCPELRPAVRAVRSAFLLDAVSRSIVHALKYRGWHRAAVAMGRRMAAVTWPAEVVVELDLVVPVPITPVRTRQRGYNQAALLAAETAAIRGWKYDETVLERTRSTGSQTTLHPGERRANVAGAFRVGAAAGGKIAMRHVLIVDDVWTTGATALSCADALLAGGARAVSVLTFARALPELERTGRRVNSARR